MPTRSLEEIIQKIHQLQFNEEFNQVIGIATGGIVPAYLIAEHLHLPLDFLWINFRDENHHPQKPKPELTKLINIDFNNKSILLVDDRANTGQTLQFAKTCLAGAKSIKTLIVNGSADYSLFNESCFRFPWKVRE